jgi:LPS sulfotransferase NodH
MTSNVRRAAWAWRRYVAAGRVAGLALELRYERLVADPAGTATLLAGALDISETLLRGALETAFSSSVGRFRDDLSRSQVAAVEAEAGPLLSELGYL